MPLICVLNLFTNFCRLLARLIKDDRYFIKAIHRQILIIFTGAGRLHTVSYIQSISTKIYCIIEFYIKSITPSQHKEIKVILKAINYMMLIMVLSYLLYTSKINN